MEDSALSQTLGSVYQVLPCNYQLVSSSVDEWKLQPLEPPVPSAQASEQNKVKQSVMHKEANDKNSFE